jgi:hypothetical protein
MGHDLALRPATIPPSCNTIRRGFFDTFDLAANFLGTGDFKNH